MSDYPEHDKLTAVREQSQAIGEFLDMGPYTLCEFREAGDNGEPKYVWKDKYLPDLADTTPTTYDYVSNRAENNPNYESWPSGYVPVMKPISDILAEWFGIDQTKLEKEKRAMLDKLRAMNA